MFVCSCCFTWIISSHEFEGYGIILIFLNGEKLLEKMPESNPRSNSFTLKFSLG